MLGTTRWWNDLIFNTCNKTFLRNDSCSLPRKKVNLGPTYLPTSPVEIGGVYGSYLQGYRGSREIFAVLYSRVQSCYNTVNSHAGGFLFVSFATESPPLLTGSSRPAGHYRDHSCSRWVFFPLFTKNSVYHLGLAHTLADWVAFWVENR